jgi:hypothetical protein
MTMVIVSPDAHVPYAWENRKYFGGKSKPKKNKFLNKKPTKQIASDES